MKDHIKEVETLFEQYMKNEISADEFEQKRQSIDKKYDILTQEKIIKSMYLSISFNILAVVVCGFLSISSLFENKNLSTITNGVLTILNSVNLYFNIKKLNNAKLKLTKDCLL